MRFIFYPKDNSGCITICSLPKQIFEKFQFLKTYFHPRALFVCRSRQIHFCKMRGAQIYSHSFQRKTKITRAYFCAKKNTRNSLRTVLFAMRRANLSLSILTRIASHRNPWHATDILFCLCAPKTHRRTARQCTERTLHTKRPDSRSDSSLRHELQFARQNDLQSTSPFGFL